MTFTVTECLCLHIDSHHVPPTLEFLPARQRFHRHGGRVVASSAARERLRERDRCQTFMVLAIGSAASIENGEEHASISGGISQSLNKRKRRNRTSHKPGSMYWLEFGPGALV